MIIYLVRHPETKYDRRGLLKGHKDSALTKEGKNTAKKLGRVLKDKNITKIYSSDLGRCLQTSKIINKFLRVQIIPVPELKERNVGELNGKPVKLVKKTLNLSDPDEKAPNGESFNQMKARVLKSIKSLKNSRKVLIVTHHGPTKAILSDYYNIDSNSDKCETSTDTVCRLELKDSKFINLIENVSSI